MPITCWTQNYNYESQEHGEVTLEQGEQLLRGFAWTSQAEAFEAGLAENQDVCPPGIGFKDRAALFHFHVGEPGSWDLQVEIPSKGKMLGFIPKGPKKYHATVSDLDQAAAMLRLFFNDRDALESQLRR